MLENGSEGLREEKRNYSSGASLNNPENSKREDFKYSYQPKRYQSSTNRNSTPRHNLSKMSRGTEKTVFGDDSQLNTIYSRLMSASQASKVKKLIGEKNVELDVRKFLLS